MSPCEEGALLSDIRRLLDYLKSRRQGYGSALAFHLTNALFQTARRFEELIQLTWSDCQRVGEEIVALRTKKCVASPRSRCRCPQLLVEWNNPGHGGRE